MGGANVNLRVIPLRNRGHKDEVVGSRHMYRIHFHFPHGSLVVSPGFCIRIG